MNTDLSEKISLKRDKIAARHIVAASHKQAYEIEQQLIAKEGEELEQLLLLEQREALAKTSLNQETRREVAGTSRTGLREVCGPPEPATGVMTKAEENAIAVGPQKPRW